jgi:hypothetical protein
MELLTVMSHAQQTRFGDLMILPVLTFVNTPEKLSVFKMESATVMSLAQQATFGEMMITHVLLFAMLQE